mmetsp:Transcript_7592/g.13919  ORF Transcript_7592/g.13919 Transcript_7592/m.13919 type:complete len:86 (-) Transcript_7592:720-977(-)
MRVGQAARKRDLKERWAQYARLLFHPLKDDDPPMNETNTGRMCCKGARFPSGVFEARERGVSCVLVTCHTSMPRYFLSQQQCRRR